MKTGKYLASLAQQRHNIVQLEVQGSFVARLLAGGPSGLLTSSLAPFGRLSHVTHAPIHHKIQDCFCHFLLRHQSIKMGTYKVSKNYVIVCNFQVCLLLTVVFDHPVFGKIWCSFLWNPSVKKRGTRLTANFLVTKKSAKGGRGYRFRKQVFDTFPQSANLSACLREAILCQIGCFFTHCVNGP